MLLLHPTLTCADVPCTLIFAPCACSGCHRYHLMVLVFLPQPLAQILHLHTWQFHPLQLAPVVFYLHPLAQILYLHLGKLHCVVVVFWWLFLYI